jgi:MFS family permease
MRLLRYILHQALAILREYWSKRSKGYVRVTLALIGVGSAVFAVSPLVFGLQLIFSIALSGSNEPPWWVAPATGIFCILAGLAVFCIFYRNDPERLRSMKMPEGWSIGLGREWTFEQAAILIGKLADTPVVLEGFSRFELDIPLREQSLEAGSPEQLLRNLRDIAVVSGMPYYTVKSEKTKIKVIRT